MAKPYKVDWKIRFVNRMMTRMIRWNVAPPRTYLLTVTGRKTGKKYANPVTLVEQKETRWLVSPYGESNWVKNTRAAGEVSLFAGGKTDTFKIRELNERDSAPILKEYITLEGFVRPYFDIKYNSDVEDFVKIAHKHPVFKLEAA